MDRRKGIRARGDSLELDFYYKDERFRCGLKLSPTKKSHWETAERILASIKYDILRDDFNLSKYFPEHPKAKRFRNGYQILISEALEQWLEHQIFEVEKSTWRDYKSSVSYHLIPNFGALSLCDLKATDIRNWYQTAGISNKRIDNVLIPLRAIYSDAYAEELIDKNPLERIPHLKPRTPEPDPFTKNEVDSILSVAEGQIKNIFQFAFWTGLRTSELIALRWDDVNLDKGIAYIRRTRTRADEKNRTKTESGVRQLELLPPALYSLNAQREYTTQDHIFLNPPYRRALDA